MYHTHVDHSGRSDFINNYHILESEVESERLRVRLKSGLGVLYIYV